MSSAGDITLPLDHPSAARAHRVYYALTNHCNRACPWCSTCSSPLGTTFLSLADFRARFPTQGAFEAQLEGGEPTLHPHFWQMVAAARSEPRCTRLVLCTNGVVLPRQEDRLKQWLARLGAPLTVKLSFNHHLIEKDAGLPALAVLLQRLCQKANLDFVLNVRLRPDHDDAVAAALERTGLRAHANVFELQAYGFASEEAWAKPFVVGQNFTLVNPDGSTQGTDLVQRSEAMRVLP